MSLVARRNVQTLDAIVRSDLEAEEVCDNQIIRALLREVGFRFAQGFLYEVLQGVANEARRRHLLINPNPLTRQLYSAAVGSTHRMKPSLFGWEQIKGILSRHLHEARENEQRRA